MTDWLFSLFDVPCYFIGNVIWNMIMLLIGGVITTTPQGFSSEAWNYASETLYPWALGIGVALLNLFFLIGFFREASNLRENVTWEILCMYVIKTVLANGFMQGGMSIMREFFKMASELTGQIYLENIPPFSTGDMDFGTYLFFFLFGIIYILVALVCGFMILFTVYGRYLKLYVLIPLAPIALSTMAGGKGLEQSAFAWIKMFLASVFEIVVIAIVMTIAGKMIYHLDFGAAGEGLLSIGDGFVQILQNIFTMIIMAGAVKGADATLRRSFAL